MRRSNANKANRPHVPQNATDEERLRWHGWDETANGCWEWRGSRHPQGYGVVGRKSVLITTHRLSYMTWVGPIPEGHVVRHKCDNPPCINPEHLETGTKGQNNEDTARRDRSRRKLTRSDVEDIRWLFAEGAVQAHIARSYGISTSHINLICRGLSRA